MKLMNRDRRCCGRQAWRWTAPLLAAALAAGCAPGSSSNDDVASDQPADEEAQGEDQDEVVLRVLDARAGEPQLQATYDRLDEEFESQNPGVRVERESINLEELLATINLRLSESDVPDVAAINQGHATMGRLIQAGLIRPLDDAADRDGWIDAQSETLLAMNGRYSEEDATMAEGELYAVSDTGAPVGMFYNVDHLETLGVDVPSTWDEFEAVLAAASEEGMTPLMFGNVDAWPGIHLYQLFWNDLLGRAAADFVYGVAPMDESTGTQASELAQTWVDNGWLADGWEGIDYDSTWQRFGDGDGVFLATGSWIAADLAEADADIRFVLMPPSQGDAYVATSAGDFPMAVPTNAANPDLAEAFVAFRVSDDAARIYIEDGHIPASLPEDWRDYAEDGTIQYDLLEAWERLEADDGMIPYVDWATPDFYEVATAEIQNLLGFNTSPEAFVDAWNTEWRSFHEQD
jgi:raffinose/stachyose/melibiose transport system substrate-binding protein